MGGIRHYDTKEELEAREARKKFGKTGTNNSKRADDKLPEFHLNTKFDSVSDALNIFKDDQLLSEPGEDIANLAKTVCDIGTIEA